MDQTSTARIPLQSPGQSRVLDGLSGQIGKIAPTALNETRRAFQPHRQDGADCFQ